MFVDVVCTDVPLPTAEVLSGSVEIIDQLASEWRMLCEHSRYDTPFHRPEWIAAYVRAFAHDKTVVLATVRSGGRLTAVLPLIQENGLIGGVPARKLRAAGNVHTCRFDLVHRVGFGEMAIPAVWNALRSMPGWDLLELPDVPIRGAAGKLARLASAQGYATHVTRAATSPYLTLRTPDGASPHPVARIDSKFRSNLRRRMRKLQLQGPVELTCTHQADERLAHFYELERAGWKGAERSAIVSNAPTREFYQEVARQCERLGTLCIYTLECAGRPVAMFYGLQQRSRYFLLKTAYDESFSDCSPGQLITQEVLRALTAERCVEFDFLGVLTNWKKDWLPQLRPHSNWYVFRGPWGRALHRLRFQMRPAVGRTLRALRRSAAAQLHSARIDDARTEDHPR
jgi:CelD/BcsL family acetyltransferase involved in cellulose biosynthesis